MLVVNQVVIVSKSLFHKIQMFLLLKILATSTDCPLPLLDIYFLLSLSLETLDQPQILFFFLIFLFNKNIRCKWSPSGSLKSNSLRWSLKTSAPLCSYCSSALQQCLTLWLVNMAVTLLFFASNISTASLRYKQHKVPGVGSGRQRRWFGCRGDRGSPSLSPSTKRPIMTAALKAWDNVPCILC